MKSINRKEIVEIIGLAAIVASLVFVGVQLRQSQNIAMAEGFSMLFSTRVEIGNSIKEHADIWRRGAAGEKLRENEAEIFAILVYQLNESAVQGFLHVWQVAGADEARFSARDFAGFLYQNPGARTIWSRREDNLATYRHLQSNYTESEDIWADSVLYYLAELDRLKPEVAEDVFVDW